MFLCSAHGNPTEGRPPSHCVPWLYTSVSAARIRPDPGLCALKAGGYINRHTHYGFALKLLLGKTVNMARLPLSLSPCVSPCLRALLPPPPPHSTLPVNSHPCQLRLHSSPDLWPSDTSLIWAPRVVHGWGGTFCISMTLVDVRTKGSVARYVLVLKWLVV